MGMTKTARAMSQWLLKSGSMFRNLSPPGPVLAETAATMAGRPPTVLTAK